MTYQVHVSACRSGRPINILGPFGNISSARQAIIDAAKLTDLPDRGPDYGLLDIDPENDVVEGWIINDTEFAIVLLPRDPRELVVEANRAFRLEDDESDFDDSDCSPAGPIG